MISLSGQNFVLVVKKLFSSQLRVGLLCLAAFSGAIVYFTQATSYAAQDTGDKIEAIDEFKAAAGREKDVFDKLNEIEKVINTTTDDINQAKQDIANSDKVIETSTGKQKTLDEQIKETEASLREISVDEYVKGSKEDASAGIALSPIKQLRSTELFNFATVSAADLLERLKDLKNEKSLEVALVNKAEIVKAENIQRQEEKLIELQEQKKNFEAEWERVKDDYDKAAKEIESFAAEDEALRKLLAESETRRSFLGESFRLPVQPVCITSPYNPNRLHPVYRTVRPHRGTDFRARFVPIYAVTDGDVIATNNHGSRGWGKHMILDHGLNDKGQRVTTLYAHLSEMSYSVGTEVSSGTQIGVSGATGGITGPHLHFEVALDGTQVDPANFYDAGSVPTCPGF